MNFKYLLVLFIAISPYIAVAQEPPNEDLIRNSGDYFYGSACSEISKEATDFAVTELLSQISVNVSADYKTTDKLKTENNSQSYESTVQGVVKTYTSGVLRNYESFKEPRDCGIYVFYWMPKSVLNDILDYRKDLVRDMFDKAKGYADNGNYAGALKYYNFANVLLNSIPVSRVEHRGKNLELEIPSRISEIISGTRFEILEDNIISEKRREIILGITVKGETAKSLDFTYWDGNDQILTKSQDGVASVLLLGNGMQLTNLQLSIKYQYYENKDEIKEVGQLWSLVTVSNLPNRKSLRLERSKEKKPQDFGLNDTKKNVKVLVTNDVGQEFNDNEELPIAVDKTVEEKISTEIENLESFYNKGTSIAAWNDDDFLNDKLNRIKKFNNIEVSPLSTRQNINNTYDGWEFRQMSGSTFYPSINLRGNEYLVPDYDSLGTLVDVNFGILDGLYDQFKRASTFGEDWDKRQVIIKFVEKYRTAYMTRDLEQLEVMFAEEAVIIVGRVLRKDEEDKTSYEMNTDSQRQPNFEQIKMTKNTFLKRQKSIFDRKRDIHLGFTTFEILKKNNTPGVYGVSMRQVYTSDGYADEGYLFLLVDFNDDQPKIYVRAWQPQEWDQESLIGLSNFNIRG